ncbi:DUF397 domain-containing protein [Streptomyces sp. NPDC127117]|uniref:DUF397 domain-containing protein n=1 Tax=Streptomyces sp. NPDC127117 TaxID=3345368 RepID=UPI003628222C
MRASGGRTCGCGGESEVGSLPGEDILDGGGGAVASTPGAVLVRDSKNAQGARLAFASDVWAGSVSYAAER